LGYIIKNNLKNVEFGHVHVTKLAENEEKIIFFLPPYWTFTEFLGTVEHLSAN
jgi:hypothetical protein